VAGESLYPARRRSDTLHRREMFADKPALQLVRAYDVADDEIIDAHELLLEEARQVAA
jgi:hypothetical protein